MVHMPEMDLRIPKWEFRDTPNGIMFLNTHISNVDFSVVGQLNHGMFAVTQYGTNTQSLIKVTPKVAHYTVYPNGIVLRRRQTIRLQDIGRAKPLCTYPDFHITVNDRGTAVVFSRNVTSVPKT